MLQAGVNSSVRFRTTPGPPARSGRRESECHPIAPVGAVPIGTHHHPRAASVRAAHHAAHNPLAAHAKSLLGAVDGLTCLRRHTAAQMHDLRGPRRQRPLRRAGEGRSISRPKAVHRHGRPCEATHVQIDILFHSVAHRRTEPQHHERGSRHCRGPALRRHRQETGARRSTGTVRAHHGRIVSRAAPHGQGGQSESQSKGNVHPFHWHPRFKIQGLEQDPCPSSPAPPFCPVQAVHVLLLVLGRNGAPPEPADWASTGHRRVRARNGEYEYGAPPRTAPRPPRGGHGGCYASCVRRRDSTRGGKRRPSG